MKTPEEMKRELHEYIDRIDDEKTLLMVHEEVSSYLKDDTIKENDELTEEQEKQLVEAIRQADAGETMPWEDLKASLEEWRKK
ncbi:MAG: hypothetical protein ABI594_15320 [Ginsengibacter sp.]